MVSYSYIYKLLLNIIKLILFAGLIYLIYLAITSSSSGKNFLQSFFNLIWEQINRVFDFGKSILNGKFSSRDLLSTSSSPFDTNIN